MRIFGIELTPYSLEVCLVNETSGAPQHDSAQVFPRVPIDIENNSHLRICLNIPDLRRILIRSDVDAFAIQYRTHRNIVWHTVRADCSDAANSLLPDEIGLGFCELHSYFTPSLGVLIRVP